MDNIGRLKAECNRLKKLPPNLEELRRSRPSGTPMQMSLRQALRTHLDLKITPVVKNASGGQDVMSIDDMTAAYKRRQAHMMAYRQMLAWAITQTQKLGGGLPPGDAEGRRWLAPKERPLETPRVAVAFWHSVGGAPRRLPASFVEGITSCVRVSGLKVVLLTFQDLENLPEGVFVRDANEYMRMDEFNCHLSSMCVQHLSDFIRALALQRGVDGAIYVRKYVNGNAHTYARTHLVTPKRAPQAHHGSPLDPQESPLDTPKGAPKRHRKAHK